MVRSNQIMKLRIEVPIEKSFLKPLCTHTSERHHSHRMFFLQTNVFLQTNKHDSCLLNGKHGLSTVVLNFLRNCLVVFLSVQFWLWRVVVFVRIGFLWASLMHSHWWCVTHALFRIYKFINGAQKNDTHERGNRDKANATSRNVMDFKCDVLWLFYWRFFISASWNIHFCSLSFLCKKYGLRPGPSLLLSLIVDINF